MPAAVCGSPAWWFFCNLMVDHLRFFVKQHKSQEITEIRRPVRLPLQQDLVMRSSNGGKLQQFIFTWTKREATTVSLMLKQIKDSSFNSLFSTDNYKNGGIKSCSPKPGLTSMLFLPLSRGLSWWPPKVPASFKFPVVLWKWPCSLVELSGKVSGKSKGNIFKIHDDLHSWTQ